MMQDRENTGVFILLDRSRSTAAEWSEVGPGFEPACREDEPQKKDEKMNTRRTMASWIGWVVLLMAFAPGMRAAEFTIWHIKAVHPEGRLLDIKAVDKDGKRHDVKALEEQGNRHVMDIKALMDGKRLPVKILVSDDKFAPVKAIGPDGTIYDIKAFTPDGTKLDVKGVSRSGSIYHIKAIAPDGTFYGVKAISPGGVLHDVKGVKMRKEPVEATINGVDVAAHVKALPQVSGAGK